MYALLEKMANPNECSLNLRREFLEFHKHHTTTPPPAIDTTGNISNFLTNLYKKADGMLVGERHFDNLSINFLTEYLPHLAALGVKTLFFEGLFFGMEKGLDGLRDEKDSTHPEYARLIDAARHAGLQIVGLDASGCKRGSGITRDIFMNAYAQTIINRLENRGKWVGLVGMMHLNDTLYIDPENFVTHPVRGLATLTGAVSIILQNSTTNAIHPGGLFEGLPGKWISSDYLIEVNQHPVTRSDTTSEPNPLSNLATVLKPHNITLTHFDIDNLLPKGEALVFALRTPSAYYQLESLKYNILKNTPTASPHWLSIRVHKNEIIVSCHLSMAERLTHTIETVFLTQLATHT